MTASILDTATLGKVILYSFLAGVGVCVVFAVGVSSAVSVVDALRERRAAAGLAWGATAAICLIASLGAVVLGIVVMATK